MHSVEHNLQQNKTNNNAKTQMKSHPPFVHHGFDSLLLLSLFQNKSTFVTN